jgi:glyoxylase-like metal-dependent hydrolase (beta-lactamase superfamily II)
MDLIRLTDEAYQLKGGSNAGLLLQGGQAILIDTGLDKDTAKKILRHLDGLKARVVAVVVTHAHADHFGGAATIKARTGAPVYAPALESAIVENPILEPLYLFSGAMPPAELRHKFTLAEPCQVDGLLQPGPFTLGPFALQVLPAPGHAPNQMMVGAGGACFVADAVFAPEVLAKHGIPFMVDVDAWLETLGKLPDLDGVYGAFVPGHGPVSTGLRAWAQENAARLQELRDVVARAALSADSVSDVVKVCADHFKMNVPNLTLYLLAQTSILACLASLHAAGQTHLRVEQNRLRLA